MNTAQAQLGAVLSAGGPALTRLLERTEVRLAEVAESHGVELGAHAAGTLAAGGKRLRPVLVFLCGDASDERLVAGGAAVELLHMATLVHDDVLDAAELRRGRPTVFAVAGRPAATATGDLLFSRAFAELAGPPADPDEDAIIAGARRSVGERQVALLAEASVALAKGELAQRGDAFDLTLTRERYLRRCELKTARLFECACAIGRADPGADDALVAFGREIGLAFQLLDDVLDVSGPPERTGKARGTDLLDGTVTLPLIRAREVDPSLGQLDLRALDGPEAEAVCERIAATGALERVRAEARERVELAKQVAGAAPLEREQRELLALVADGVVERYS
jgi:geranylgeranyl pyrophosphate synthase